ncbi:MAG: hypothetical protein ACREBG_02385 [Pyrinomonadaceae bacterium]
MNRTLIFFAISLILLVGSSAVLADLAPPPKPSPQQGKFVLNTGLEVVPDANVTYARLQIPQASLQELRTALANAGEADVAGPRIAHGSTRTIVAGVFLFLSLSFGGVWLARASQSRSQKVVAAMILTAAVFGAATIITRANAGPPPTYLWRNLPQNLGAGRATQGPVKIEIVAEDNGIKLFIPLKVNKSDKKAGEE